MNKQQMCPFCQFMGIDESEYQPIESDEFGHPAMIGGIRSCDGCAKVAVMEPDTTNELLEQLEQVQAKERAVAEAARQADLKKLAAWNAMCA